MAHAAHSGEHGDYHRGEMAIGDQKATFHGFLVATVWGCGLVAMAVALLTFAFAMGLGWWAGLAAFVIIGVATGVIFKLGGAWWALLAASTIFLGLGGIIIPPIAGLMG
ncbi:MAG: aa3-type cytochrome c oxidase subunit IV [Hyphomonadaceae bacterium]